MDERHPNNESINQSLLASDIAKNLPKKKIRIKRLVRKQDGNMTLQDTTLNETQDSIAQHNNQKNSAHVNYNFTNNKNIDSFQVNHDTHQRQNFGVPQNENHGEGHLLNNFTNQNGPQKMNFGKKKIHPTNTQKQKKEQTIPELLKTEDFIAQFNEKSSRKQVPEWDKAKFVTMNAPREALDISEISTQNSLFRLPKNIGSILKNKAELQMAVQYRVEAEKEFTLKKMDIFKQQLIKQIESKFYAYNKDLAKEYNDFYVNYKKDIMFLQRKCMGYQDITKNPISLENKKIKINSIEFFNQKNGKILSSEKTPMTTYLENKEFIVEKKKINALIDELNRRISHVPGFAKTKTSEEFIKSSALNMGAFCDANLNLLDNIIYKPDHIKLQDIEVKCDFDITEIRPTRKSVKRFELNPKDKEKEVRKSDPKVTVSNSLEMKAESGLKQSGVDNMWKESMERKEREEHHHDHHHMQQNSNEPIQKQHDYPAMQTSSSNPEQLISAQPIELQEHRSSLNQPKQPAKNLKNSDIEFENSSFNSHNVEVKSKPEVIVNVNTRVRDSEYNIDPNNTAELTEEQKQIIANNKAKHELYLQKKNEIGDSDIKSIYEKMSIYSIREEHLNQSGTNIDIAEKNLADLNNMIAGSANQMKDLENLLDENAFANNKNGDNDEIENLADPSENPLRPDVKRILGLTFKRSNIDIQKIVKGKKLNGLIEAGDQLYFFGDEFIFRCTLQFKNPLLYRLSLKELTYLESLHEDFGPGVYLLGVVNKKTRTSEVMFISLTNKFNLQICTRLTY